MSLKLIAAAKDSWACFYIPINADIQILPVVFGRIIFTFLGVKKGVLGINPIWGGGGDSS